MNDDFDQDPEESPEFVPEEDEEEFDPFSDPNYHAPNRCNDPNCWECDDDDDGAGSEKFPGEDIWWKTNDKYQ